MGYEMKDFRNHSINDRINKLLVSYKWSDCSFSVHGKKFKAHKLILGISSPVFEAMFYGPLSTNEIITITDIEPHIFQQLLNYIYTDKIKLHSIEDSYDLLYVSRKYMLENLGYLAISHIQSNISFENVILVLNYPDHMQDNQLILTAIKLFCQHAEYLFKENKYYINPTCMQKILSCNEINISEKDLIKNVFEWTTLYCEQNEIQTNFQNRRDLLINNGLLELLRFLTLSLNEVEEITACKDNLLSNCEEEKIKEAIKHSEIKTKKIVHNLDLNLRKRAPLTLQWCFCHRSSIRSESPLIIDPAKHIIHTKIKANRSTFINSLSVQSKMSPVMNFCPHLNNIYYEQFAVTVKCKEDDKIIKEMDFEDNIEYDSTIDIEFDEPFLIKKDIWYQITFTWPQFYTLYGNKYSVQSRDTCYDNGKIKFEFNDFPNSFGNSGSFLKGLKYCI